MNTFNRRVKKSTNDEVENSKYTVVSILEGYGYIYLDYKGNEVSRPCEMSYKQAKYLSKIFDALCIKL